jgi:hypothetical protein
MNAQQTNKLRSYLATQAVFDENESTWQTLPAFAAAVEEFKEVIPQINSLAQTQASRGGMSDEKAYALEAMGNAAYETAAAVFAYADKAQDFELAGRVDFPRSAITDGRESEIVARCRDILAAASANVDSLSDYGINQTKLNALKKKIDAFEAVQPAPRTQVVKSSAATKLLPAQFKTADSILSNRLDGLVVQFRDVAPEFFNQYISARSIVSSPGGRGSNNAASNGSGTPTPEKSS